MKLDIEQTNATDRTGLQTNAAVEGGDHSTGSYTKLLGVD
jgi:hypothetical protein